MKPLLVLLLSFAIVLVGIKLTSGQLRWPLAGRIAMACMLLFTAMGHFIFTYGMTAMIPDFLPFKKEIVLLTGVVEIVFAIGLLIPKLRCHTAWLLLLFFILMVPANIKAAVENINYQTGEFTGPGIAYLWFRIPLQMFFIGWVYFTAIRN
ncbi:MAG: hypothetical protein AAF717_04575 [Bacteroidota bacterium]